MIRKATPEDFEAILDMAQEFWVHTQFDEPFERDHTLNMVNMCYDHDLLLVAEDDGICGFIAAIKGPLLGSSKAFCATEVAWFVIPEKRGRIHGIRLIQSLERLCIEQEVKYLSMAFMETSMPDKVKHLYESLGYTLQETLYTKRLIDGSNHNRSYSGRNGGLRGSPATRRGA